MYKRIDSLTGVFEPLPEHFRGRGEQGIIVTQNTQCDFEHTPPLNEKFDSENTRLRAFAR